LFKERKKGDHKKSAREKRSLTSSPPSRKGREKLNDIKKNRPSLKKKTRLITKNSRGDSEKKGGRTAKKKRVGGKYRRKKKGRTRKKNLRQGGN